MTFLKNVVNPTNLVIVSVGTPEETVSEDRALLTLFLELARDKKGALYVVWPTPLDNKLEELRKNIEK